MASIVTQHDGFIQEGDKRFRALNVHYLETPALCTDTGERQVMTTFRKGKKKDPAVGPISVLWRATEACPGM